MSYLFVNIVFSYKYVCQSILSSEIKLAWVKQQVFLFLQEEYNEKLQFVYKLQTQTVIFWLKEICVKGANKMSANFCWARSFYGNEYIFSNVTNAQA